MQSAKPAPLDPRGEIDRYCNKVFGVVRAEDTVMITFGVERPVAGADPSAGKALAMQHEISARVVLPVKLAQALGQVLQQVAAGETGPPKQAM